MSAKEPKSIQSVLQQQNSALAALSQSAQNRQTLIEQIQQTLPMAFRECLFAANIDDTQLTLVCTSAAWATRLRFYSETLKEILAADHKICVEHIKIKVRPAQMSTPSQ